jgi:hypothetical protein
MNRIDDLDRRLLEWLRDGPERAPDARLTGAIAHARSNPRRPDPFALFRRDAMSRPTRLASGLRPVSLGLALVLLVTTVVGVGLSGGQPTDRAAAPPLASASPSRTVGSTSTPDSTNTTAAPSASASPVVTSSRSTSVVRLDVQQAGTVKVVVTDLSGRLVGARSAKAGSGASVEPAAVAVQNVDSRTLRLTWSDNPCALRYLLTVDPTAHSIRIDAPTCEGDSIGIDRVIVLQFSAPIDAGDVEARIIAVSPSSAP